MLADVFFKKAYLILKLVHLLIASSLKKIVFGSITYSCHLNIIFHYINQFH